MEESTEQNEVSLDDIPEEIEKGSKYEIPTECKIKDNEAKDTSVLDIVEYLIECEDSKKTSKNIKIIETVVDEEKE